MHRGIRYEIIKPIYVQVRVMPETWKPEGGTYIPIRTLYLHVHINHPI